MKIKLNKMNNFMFGFTFNSIFNTDIPLLLFGFHYFFYFHTSSKIFLEWITSIPFLISFFLWPTSRWKYSNTGF